MPAVKTLLRDLTLNSGGIMKLGCIGTEVDGVKFRGNNEALLHWERHRWRGTYYVVFFWGMMVSSHLPLGYYLQFSKEFSVNMS
jgi:hypothetical protein